MKYVFDLDINKKFSNYLKEHKALLYKLLKDKDITRCKVECNEVRSRIIFENLKSNDCIEFDRQVDSEIGMFIVDLDKRGVKELLEI